MADSLAPLLELTTYPRLFMDLTLWQPYVTEVCARHHLTCQAVRTGVAGTFPAFIVDNCWVIKFFGPLFDGERCFEVEQQAASLLADQPALPVAPLLAQGCLWERDEPWRWPYLIFQFIHGESIGTVYEQVGLESRLALAVEMGAWIKRLHALPLPQAGPLAASWDSFTDFLSNQYARCTQQQAEWGSLPLHLIEQIPAFLPPIGQLLDSSDQPRLVHADLTRDHLLGLISEGNRWETHALIDFGDARAASPKYELPALHLDLLNCDKRMLRAFLESYGWNDFQSAGFAHQAMAYTLLHEFNVLALYPQAKSAASLSELAVRIWQL